MLTSLELTNVRSYGSAVFQFSDAVNIIVGPNASGKTNLLEAIYMIAKGGSFKNSDENMISKDANWARIEATYLEERRIVKLQKTPFAKTLEFDGVSKKRIPTDKIIPVILFEPAHMNLFSGEPEARRNYLDYFIAQLQPNYAPTLSSYKRTLQQRNRLLKQENFNPSHIFAWDLRLSELAGQLVETRQKYISSINLQLSENYQSVSGNNENLEIIYHSKLPIDSYASNMLNKLKKDLELDKLRGFTGVGPHRDDLSVLIEGDDIKTSASRGENRSVILSLKITELKSAEQNLLQNSNKKPLLLLDDVFSELDGKRRKTLAKSLNNYQTFITTTDADVAMDYFSKNCNIIPTNTD